MSCLLRLSLGGRAFYPYKKGVRLKSHTPCNITSSIEDYFSGRITTLTIDFSSSIRFANALTSSAVTPLTAAS